MIPQLAPTREAAPVSVFIAARHERVRAALWQLLEHEPGIEPLAATADLADMIRLLERLRPAVVVVDQSVLGDAGLDALSRVAEVAPQAAFIVVGMHDHPGYVTWAREAGAADYVCLDEAADRLGPSVADASARGAVRRRAPACGDPRGNRSAVTWR
jgi:two-component system nitrate/nitrite response regulator NarL